MLAPGGYGKSVLLRTLAAQRPNTLYLALTSADADRAVLQPCLGALINDPKATVILDDVHHLENDSETMCWFNELLAAPEREHARLILSGRRVELPALPLLVAQHKVTCFGRTDLAFSRQESAVLGVSDEWHRRTEGWPLALALCQQLGAQAVGAVDPSLTTTQLFDSLVQSLLAGLPNELLRFMQLSAVPLRVNVDLAAGLIESTPAKSAVLLREALGRNLFLEETKEPGWFRFHDLIRDYLLRQFDPTDAQQTTVSWFADHHDLPMAIEQALASQLYGRASELLDRLPERVLRDEGRYRTFQRWVRALPQPFLIEQPKHLARLGKALTDMGHYAESEIFLEEALAYAHRHSDSNTRAFVCHAAARHYNFLNQFEKANHLLRSALAEPELSGELRQSLHNSLGCTYASRYHLPEAKREFEASLGLALQEGFEDRLYQIRHNLAYLVYQPLGQFKRAEELLRQNDLFVANKAGWLSIHLLVWCGFHESLGQWDELAVTVQRMRQADAEMDEASEDRVWEWWYDALQAIGHQEYQHAQVALDAMSPSVGLVNDTRLCEALARGWLLQRQGQLQNAIHVVSIGLAQSGDSPLYRGALALLYETLLFVTNQTKSDLHPDIMRIIYLRARPWMMRLRALLALRCHQAGNPRWQIHLQSVLRTSQRYGYGNILITREPDLGAYFWTLCIEEEIATEQATTALQRIGRTDLLCALLQHPSPAVRCRTLRVLAVTGNEATIPTLAEKLATEKDETVRAALECTIEKLETSPPPTLHVTLLGEFSAQRGDTLIAADDWQRPAARRLFQYLVLNQGKPLPRDRILEELWPNSAPDAARSSFKTVYSWLRKAIEPYLRPKSSSRYILVDQETYTFNPQRSPAILHSDVAEFEAVVKAVLKDADNYDVRPMPADFVAALDGWKPLLPELSYEPWTLDTRERLLNLYVQGCLYTASAMLDIDKPIDAAGWAERVIAIAPWSEEGWQELIRAQARQGKRTLALKSYEAAVVALKRELDAPPSSMLEWLAKRLRADEAI